MYTCEANGVKCNAQLTVLGKIFKKRLILADIFEYLCNNFIEMTLKQ